MSDSPGSRVTRLCIVRHGETDWNASHRAQGQVDIPLSAIGHRQAQATARVLATAGLDVLYSSDLARARETAEATARLAGLPLQLLSGLRERHFGLFQGLTADEAAQRHPEDYARHRSREPAFVPPGGESIQQLATRIVATCAEIVGRHPGKSVALFTHGGVLDILHRHVAGQPLHTPRDFPIPNCGISWISVADERWTLLRWADHAHLDKPLEVIQDG